MKRLPRHVLLVEDDALLSIAIQRTIQELGNNCAIATTVSDAEKYLRMHAVDFLIADLCVPFGLGKAKAGRKSTSGDGRFGGLELLRFVHHRYFKTKLMLVTGQPSSDAAAWCRAKNVAYRTKPIDSAGLSVFLGRSRRKAFIVHGRNKVHLKKVKNALKVAGIDPLVLMEQPSSGRTVIEKFEAMSKGCDCAVVIVSADDLGGLGKASRRNDLTRARQNVIFELGYFYGRFSRESGKVVIVSFDAVEIPSDLAGIIWINGNENQSRMALQLMDELPNT